MWKRIFVFFDKLEDHVRFRLSHYPIIYALIGAVGVVLVWKGVWDIVDLFPILFGPVALLVGVSILLLTGLLVSFFVGDSFLLSGLKREKKLIERTETEIRSEKDILEDIETKIVQLEQEVHASQEEPFEPSPKQPPLPQPQK